MTPERDQLEDPTTEGRAAHHEPDGETVSTLPGALELDKLSDFETFFRNEFPRVVVFLMRSGLTAEEAQDGAQQAFVEAYRHWTEIKHPRAWVRTVAQRAVWRYQRMERVQTTPDLPDLSDVRAAEMAERVETLDQMAQVFRLLRDLPPVRRQIMAWTLDGFTPKEIAEVLGKSPEAVRKNLQFARESLKAMLAKERSDGVGKFG